MSIIIKNVSVSLVPINDIGITVGIGLTYDVSIIDASDVSASAVDGDIFDVVSAGDIVVIDPRDNITELGVADSLVVLRAHNDSHYGMAAGSRIIDAEDVDDTGLANGDILKWGGTDFQTVANDHDDLTNISGGGVGDYQHFTTAEKTNINAVASTTGHTGWLSGGDVSIGTNPNEVTVSAGTGRIIRYTDPLNPVVTEVSWPQLTDVPITDIATTITTTLGINSLGQLVQFPDSILERLDYKEYILIGFISHLDNTSIDQFSSSPSMVAYDGVANVADFIRSAGAVLLEGNKVSGVAGTLQLAKTSGEVFSYGTNASSEPEIPDVAPTIATLGNNFFLGHRDPSTTDTYLSVITNVIDPLQWDDNGVLTVVGNNRWTIMPVYLISAINFIVVGYGQTTYVNLSEALTDLRNGTHVWEERAQLKNSAFLGHIVVKKEATDLTDELEATFVLAPTLREALRGSSGSGNTSGGGGVSAWGDITGTLSDQTDLQSELDTLTAHTVDTANPHDTTVNNLDDTVITSPVSGEHLVYNGSSWVNDSPLVNLPLVQVRRETSMNNLGTGWNDVYWENTDFENNTDYLELSGADARYVLLKTVGFYLFEYKTTGLTSVGGRLMLDGGTYIVGSETDPVGLTSQSGLDSTRMEGIATAQVIVECTAPNQTVHLQLRSNNVQQDDTDKISMNAVALIGVQGVSGANGQGVPSGGIAGQVLTKVDGTDYNTEWAIHVPSHNEFFVAKNGNDTTGEGTNDNPYLTINKAITEINTLSPSVTNRFQVNVSPGIFSESPFTIPAGVDVVCKTSIIVAADAANDFITLDGSGNIYGADVQGVTGAGKYCIVCSGTGTSTSIIRECTIGYLSTGAIKASSTVIGHSVIISFSNIIAFSEDGVYVDTNSDVIYSEGLIFGNGTTARGVVTNGSGTCTVTSLIVESCGTGAYHNSTGTLKSVGSSFNPSNLIPVTRVGTSPLVVRSTDLESEKLNTLTTENISGSFYDLSQGEPKFRLVDELSVGLPGNGSESAFGEGDSFVNGMLVWSWDGTTFTDVSEEASSTTGSTLSYPNLNVGSALYFSTARTVVDTGDFMKFYNIKISQTVPTDNTGELVAEYWNGSTWVELNHMSTEAESNGTYRAFAKEIFQGTGSEHIRFDSHIDPLWVANDAVGMGISTYWIRIRIETALTGNPTFEKIKIGTNRTEINADGFIEYFGDARPTSALPFDTSTFIAANNSPANNDVYLSDTLGVGRVENEFQSGVTDRCGMVLPFPPEIDTSMPIHAKFHFISDSADTGTFTFVLRHASSRQGDGVYSNTASAPSTAPGQQTITVLKAPPAIHQQFLVEFDLDISDVIARNADGSSDLFWLTLQRTGGTDANTGNAIMVQLEVTYVRWASGGHIE